MSVSTIKGYRTAIGTVLDQHADDKLANSVEISQLIRSMQLERPFAKASLPQWDLALVLNRLLLPPFEPMRQASLTFLTWKTAFLLSLASGKRSSELHALDVTRIAWTQDYKEAYLYPVPGFIPKVLRAAEGSADFRPLHLLSLRDIVDPRDVDVQLCPLRALRHYEAATKELRLAEKRLFLSSLKPHQAVCKQTVAGWLKKTVHYAYKLKDIESRRAAGIRSHEIRAIAASLAVRKNISLSEVLRTCSWKSHTTFTSHYLRDVTVLQNGLLRLGPVVVAETVV